MKKKGRKPKNYTSRSASKETTREPSVMDNGFSCLVDGYTVALEDNSAMITAMLQELTTRELSKEEKEALSSIGRDLKKIDRNINRLRG